MISTNKTYIIALILMAFNLTVSGQEEAKEIYTKATDQLLVENMVMEMELQITDKRGRVKEKGFEVYIAKFGDTEKTKMSWQKPEEAKGTTIILTEPQGETGLIEVFTPSNGKVRKLKATADNMELVGSEMSITSMPSQTTDELAFRFLDSKEIEGQSCYNIEIKSVNATGAARGEILVEESTFRIVQITVFDEKGKKTSFVKLSNYQPIDGASKKVQPMLIVTEDYTTKKQTEMRILKISSRSDLTEEDFQLPQEQDM